MAGRPNPMHTLKTIFCLCAPLLLFAFRSQSQTPVQFQTNSVAVHRIECNERSLEQLFSAGDQCELNMTGSKTVPGKIISHSTPNPFTVSLNIRLLNADSCLLHLSRNTTPQGISSYSGACISPRSKTAYRLITENGKYYFQPVEKKSLIAD